MASLKIAFLSCGTFTHIDPYLKFFKEAGYDVHWITSSTPEKNFDVPVYDISFGADPLNKRTKWKYLLAGFKIRKILEEIRPDILHGHYATSSGIIALMSRFTPYVISVHGSDLINSMDSFLWRGILRKVFRKSALVHTVSEQLSGLVQDLGISENKIFTLTQGVDVELFQFKPCKLDNPVKLICTRVLRDVYDPMTILKACLILKQRGRAFQLTFAGDGGMREEMKRWVRENHLDDAVCFMGGYKNSDLPGLLQSHHLYLSASLWDGTSISLLEAMASGIFSVVSRTTSNLAWLKDGQSAFMFESGNEEQLADRISLAIEVHGLREQAIKGNRQLIEDKADHLKNMQTLENVYQRLTLL